MAALLYLTKWLAKTVAPKLGVTVSLGAGG